MPSQAEIASLINDARGFSTDSFRQSQNLLAQATAAIGYNQDREALPSLPSSIGRANLTIPSGPPSPDLALAGQHPVPVKPTLTQTEPIQTSYDFGQIPIPGFDSGNLFSYRLPEDVAAFSEEAPDLDIEVEDVTIPDIEQFQPPSLLDLDTPVMGAIARPNFDATPPQFLGDHPADLEDKFKRSYNNTLTELQGALDDHINAFIARYYPDLEHLTKCVDKRLKAISCEGESVLGAQFETALYERQRLRINSEQSRAQREVLDTFASRGFSTPPPLVLASALGDVGRQAAERRAAAALETTEKVALRETQHLEFVINQVNSLRQQAVQAYMAYNDNLLAVNKFALDFARFDVQNAVEVYNLLVRQYEVELRAYQTDAQVWETRMKFALANLDIFKGKIEAEKLKGDLNEQRVNLYRSQVAAEVEKVNVAKARLEAIALQLENGKVPLEVYRAKVEAYQAYVSGKGAEYNVFQAAMNGDRAKIEGYVAELQAHRQRLQTVETELNISDKVNESRDRHNKSLIQQYELEIRELEARTRQEQADLSSRATIYQANVTRYQANLRANVERFQAETRSLQLDVDAQVRIGSVTADQIIKLMQLTLEQRKALAEVNVAGAGVQADIAAAAIGSQHTLVSQSNETQETI